MRNEGIVPVMDIGTNNGNGAFGNNGDWAWIIVLFLIFGWNGFGRNGSNGNGGGAMDGYVLATDFANIERKLDGVNNGICDSTFALNNTMTNGFANIQNTLCQGFNGLNVAYLQGTNNIQTQLADCCCTTQRAIDGVNYNMATNTCNITNNATQNTRDIIDAINCSYNNLHNEIVTNRMEDLKEANRMLTARNTSLELSASQNAQNTFLINQLRPTPVPAYQVANPYCCYTNNCCNSTII